ncbi:FHA domain-containing protein [bacterium]|nr:FHA domain-containing protein [bacterium]
MASLTVIKGPDKGRRYDLTVDRPTIGRDATSTIRLHDGEISRHHAEIRKTTNGFIVYDLQSSNGTYLNGERIQYALVKTGDRVRCGQTEMIFTSDASSPKPDLADKIRMTSAGSSTDGSAILSSLKQSHWGDVFSKAENTGSEWLRDSLSNLNTLYEVSEAIRRVTDVDELLEKILDLAFAAVGPDRACIMLNDVETGFLQPRAVRYAPGADESERIVISRTIADFVVEKQEGVIVADAMQDARFNASESIAELGIREAICVPLAGRHENLGVLYIDTKSNGTDVLRTQKPTKLHDNHLRLMVAIAYQAGVAIEDTRFYEASLQAERLAAVGQTIATLSHHIKNILQGLRSGSYLVNMGIEGHQHPLIEQGWKVVQKNQDKIYNLVMDMLSFSKEREPTFDMIEINQLIADVLELLKARMDESHIGVDLELDSTLDRMAMDSDGIHRVLLNVISNAIDALDEIDPPRTLKIKTELASNGRYLDISIRDNGPGIPPDAKDRIFQIFHSTKGSKGTGLGLAVSQKIVQEHGGQIRVDSEPGKGACFTIEMPVRTQLPQEDLLSRTGPRAIGPPAD